MTTFIGKTEEEAIREGLSALHVDKADVKIKLIQKPRKGFFGIGKREAKIEMVVIHRSDVESQDVQSKTDQASNENSQSKDIHKPVDNSIENNQERLSSTKQNQEVVDNLVQYLASIVEQLGVHAQIKVVHHSSKQLKLNFETNEEGLLIGKHGLTINALQSLAEIYLNRMGVYHLAVELDTADYRQRRMDILSKLAERTAREVVADGQPVYLDPMPSFERKQIHKVLEHSDHVRTYSAGREPHRAVVVAPK